LTCASTVLSVTKRRPAIALFETPSATRPRTFSLALGQFGERVFAPATSAEARDDRWINRETLDTGPLCARARHDEFLPRPGALPVA
jgi:hypothetical protein